MDPPQVTSLSDPQSPRSARRRTTTHGRPYQLPSCRESSEWAHEGVQTLFGPEHREARGKRDDRSFGRRCGHAQDLRRGALKTIISEHIRKDLGRNRSRCLIGQLVEGEQTSSSSATSGVARPQERTTPSRSRLCSCRHQTCRRPNCTRSNLRRSANLEAFFLITSCNFTEQKVRARFEIAGVGTCRAAAQLPATSLWQAFTTSVSLSQSSPLVFLQASLSSARRLLYSLPPDAWR